MKVIGSLVRGTIQLLLIAVVLATIVQAIEVAHRDGLAGLKARSQQQEGTVCASPQ